MKTKHWTCMEHVGPKAQSTGGLILRAKIAVVLDA